VSEVIEPGLSFAFGARVDIGPVEYVGRAAGAPVCVTPIRVAAPEVDAGLTHTVFVGMAYDAIRFTGSGLASTRCVDRSCG
jgi:hypothetical protein